MPAPTLDPPPHTQCSLNSPTLSPADYYARDLPEYPNAANGTGAVDTEASSPNLGNATNPRAIYTNPKYMTTIITAAPGDQEVNRRVLHSAEPAVGAGQHSVTSTNN